MYELQKIGKAFTSKFVGTGPSSYKKKNLPGRGLTKVEKHYPRQSSLLHIVIDHLVLMWDGGFAQYIVSIK